MIDRILEQLTAHKTVVKNIGYLSVLQVVNMLLPLITYPYLIRVLGKETYGIVVLAQATIAYLVILISFGFNISATKLISQYRDDKEKLSETVSATFTIKFILLLISVGILLIILLVLPAAQSHKALFCLMMWNCVYELVSPLWYFQGIEQMKFITLTALLSRLIFLVLIFLVVHSPSDYLYVPIINGIGALVSGVVGIYIIFKLHKVRFKLYSYTIIRTHLAESWPIFISRVSSFKDNTPPFLIGLFIGEVAVTYYDLAQKIVSVFIVVLDNVAVAVFPMIASTRNYAFLRKVMLYQLIAIVVLYAGLQFFGTYLVMLVGGRDLIPAASLFGFVGLFLLRPASSIIGNCVLILNGYNKAFMKNLVLSTAFYFLVTLVLYATDSLTLYTICATIVGALLFELIHRLFLVKKYDLSSMIYA
jgi:O-antigen/teichoic acid export membrane protein